MKVHELLRSVSDEDLILSIKSLFVSGDKEIDEARILEEKTKILDSISVKEDLTTLKVAQVESDSHVFLDVYAVDEEGQEFGITLAPWGIIRELDVEFDESIAPEDAAAAVFWEMTWWGDSESQREVLAGLNDRIEDITRDEESLIEINPGVKITPEILKAMEADPELAKALKGLTFDKVEKQGRKVKD